MSKRILTLIGVALVSVLFLFAGSVRAQSPVITSATPNFGLPGTSVNLIGSNFGASQGTSTVSFNGVIAAVKSWSATQIVCTSPATASTGNILVTVSSVASNPVPYGVYVYPKIVIIPHTRPFVQEGTDSASVSASSHTFSPGINIASGHYALISILIQGNANEHPTAISTSGGDSATEVDGTNHCAYATTGSYSSICPWYAKINTGGTLTFAVTFNTSLPGLNTTIFVDDVMNLHGTVDNFHFNATNSGTSISSGSFTTSTAHDFSWGSFSTSTDCGSNLTPANGYTATSASDVAVDVYEADSGAPSSQNVSVNAGCSVSSGTAVGVAFTPAP